MPASCKQVAPDVSFERGRELREWISTFLHHHLVSRSDWRRLSSPLLTGCSVKLDLAHLGNVML